MPRRVSDILHERPLLGYGVAVAVVAAVTFSRVPLAPLLGNSVPFILYFPALVFVAWSSGWRAGIVATLLSGYCAKTWFFDPYGTFTIPNWASAFRLGLFLSIGGLLSLLCNRLYERTQQLRLEKELLEKKVEERTTHLRQALQDMEAFSSTVSHDLRSPLRAMQGFSEILLQEYGPVLDKTGKDYLQRICNGALKLDALIEDLLSFAKVSGATVDVHAIDLKEAVESMRSLSPAICSAGCVHIVLANPTLLNQVLQNLIENALKFVAPGVKPEIRISSEVRGDVVRLWIADNGIGVAASDQARIFKIFERGNRGEARGTGIGLAIVERAVTKMNGRVGVESLPGMGSRFWVDLPVAVLPEA